MRRDPVRGARGRRRRASSARRGARLDLGLPPRRVPLLRPCPWQGGGRPVPGAPRAMGAEREPELLLVLPVPGALRGLLLAAVRLHRARPRRGLGAIAWIGIALWAIGNAGTIVSDRQLARWRANPANKGKTARHGLWSWSRHPNYFFEFVTWCGVAVVATTAPKAGSPGSCPPACCSSSSASRASRRRRRRRFAPRPDYAEYQRTTSVFVPLPPRRA